MPETAIAGWLSPVQAGARLGLTPQRVVQLARAGEIEHVVTPLGRLAAARARLAVLEARPADGA